MTDYVGLVLFSLYIVAATGIFVGVILLKVRMKTVRGNSSAKAVRSDFDQGSGTPAPELPLDRVRNDTFCQCLDAQYESHTVAQEVADEKVLRPEWRPLSLHTEVQDTTSDAWKALEAYIAKVRDEGSDELYPFLGIGAEKWKEIVALPKSIGKLSSVKILKLSGSHLVRIPPEIGEMTNLEEFDPYTSYCLHWYPYEITRCKSLIRSRVSTRSLYGNYAYRPPFPRLPQMSPELVPATCSVCDGPFSQRQIHQAWISLKVATDVLPLLVHACSEKCIENLPTPAFGYVQRPHLGGPDIEQPPADLRGPPHVLARSGRPVRPPNRTNALKRS